MIFFPRKKIFKDELIKKRNSDQTIIWFVQILTAVKFFHANKILHKKLNIE